MWILLIVITGYDGRMTSQQIQGISSYKQCTAISQAIKNQYMEIGNKSLFPTFTCINPKEDIK